MYTCETEDMEQVTMSEARGHFARLLDSVEQTHDRVGVTRNGAIAAVLINPDDLEALEETVAVLSDPDLRAAIIDARTSSATGELSGQQATDFLRDIAKRG